MLRQSIERRTRGPILWNGTYTDFESFSTSKYRGVDNETISFSFDFEFEQGRGYGFKKIKDIFLKTKICLEAGNKRNTCYTKMLSVDVDGHMINFNFDSDGMIKVVDSNKIRWELSNTKYQLTDTNTIIPIVGTNDIQFGYWIAKQNKDKNDISSQVFNMIKTRIREFTGSRSEGKIHDMSIAVVSGIMTDEDKLIMMESLRSTNKWEQKIKEWKSFNNNSEWRVFSALIDLYSVISNTMDINLQITSNLKNVRYVAPLRASTERYYRYQDLSIDEIDHRGENIGMFLTNIPRKWRKNLDEWTNSYFGFVIDESTSSSHIAINLKYNEGKSTNVADMGFGFSQILPIIVQLWSVSSGYEKSLRGRASKQYIFAIEQPELHLHPKMQANLASVFSGAVELAEKNDIDLRLVIETHSSAMISKFGDQIVSDELDENDVNIVIFDQDRALSKTMISYSFFNNEGELENWPDGFFSY